MEKKKGVVSEEDSKISSRITAYGQQKLEVERFLKEYDKSIIFRLGWIEYGDPIQSSQLFDTFTLIDRGCAIAYDQMLNTINIRDLVEIISKFVLNKITGVFNISNSQVVSRVTCSDVNRKIN